MNIEQQGAPQGAPAAPATPAPRIVNIPPAGRPGHEAAVAAFAERFPSASTGDMERSANGSDAQQGDPAQGEQQPASAEHQFAPHDPIAAVKAGRELAAGLQETGEIAGLDKGSAEFFATHLNAALQRPPITQAESDAQAAKTWRMLRDAYGAKADQMVADARAELAELTKRIPKLPAWLDHTGAGSDAGVIQRLATRHQERTRARILAGARGR